MEKSLIKPFIAKRVAQEFTDGMVVNLGIGLPVLCTSFLPEGIHVTVHSELGIVGQGPAPDEAHADPMHIVDAGGSASSIVLGGAFSDSSDSFGLIRGGHVDAVVLGGLEVDQEGSLANWIIPGKRCPAWAARWIFSLVRRRSSLRWSTPRRATRKSLPSAACPTRQFIAWT